MKKLIFVLFLSVSTISYSKEEKYICEQIENKNFKYYMTLNGTELTLWLENYSKPFLVYKKCSETKIHDKYWLKNEKCKTNDDELLIFNKLSYSLTFPKDSSNKIYTMSCKKI